MIARARLALLVWLGLSVMTGMFAATDSRAGSASTPPGFGNLQHSKRTIRSTTILGSSGLRQAVRITTAPETARRLTTPASMACHAREMRPAPIPVRTRIPITHVPGMWTPRRSSSLTIVCPAPSRSRWCFTAAIIVQPPTSTMDGKAVITRAISRIPTRC